MVFFFQSKFYRFTTIATHLSGDIFALAYKNFNTTLFKFPVVWIGTPRMYFSPDLFLESLMPFIDTIFNFWDKTPLE